MPSRERIIVPLDPWGSSTAEDTFYLTTDEGLTTEIWEVERNR